MYTGLYIRVQLNTGECACIHLCQIFFYMGEGLHVSSVRVYMGVLDVLHFCAFFIYILSSLYRTYPTPPINFDILNDIYI